MQDGVLQIEFHFKFPVAHEMDITIPGLAVQKLKKEKKRKLRELNKFVKVTQSVMAELVGLNSSWREKRERRVGEMEGMKKEK